MGCRASSRAAPRRVPDRESLRGRGAGNARPRHRSSPGTRRLRSAIGPIVSATIMSSVSRLLMPVMWPAFIFARSWPISGSSITLQVLVVPDRPQRASRAYEIGRSGCHLMYHTIVVTSSTGVWCTTKRGMSSYSRRSGRGRPRDELPARHHELGHARVAFGLADRADRRDVHAPRRRSRPRNAARDRPARAREPVGRADACRCEMCAESSWPSAAAPSCSGREPRRPGCVRAAAW